MIAVPPLTSNPAAESVGDARRLSGSERVRHFIAVAVAVCYAFFAGLKTAADPDLGWQLAAGRWMVEHHAVLRTNVFTYTGFGREWIYPVLSQVLEYGLYRLGGYALLSWMAALACVTTVALLLRGGRFATAILAILAVPLIASRSVVRAELFSLVLFAAFVSILWNHHRTGRGPLWALPVFMAFWVNLHLGFIAGFGMCAAYLLLEAGDLLFSERRVEVRDRLRRAAPWLLATLPATLLNPWGWRIFPGMFRLMPTGPNRFILELMRVRVNSTTAMQAFAWRDYESAFFWFLGLALIAAVAALVRRRFAEAIILLGSMYAALHAARFVGLFAIIVVVLGGSVLSPSSVRDPHLAFTKLRTAFATTVLVCATLLAGVRISDLVTNRFYLRTPGQFSVFGAGAPTRFPDLAADFILREHLDPNLFNDYNSGGFLMGKLAPNYRLYIDGRGEFEPGLYVHSQQLLNEMFNDPDWLREIEDRKINTVIVSLDHEYGMGLAGLRNFCDGPGWRPVYLDPYGAVFIRLKDDSFKLVLKTQIDCSEVHFDQAATGVTSRNRANRFNYLLNSAAIFIVLDRNEEALRSLQEAETIEGRNAFLHYAKGAALLQTGRSAAAETSLRTAMELGSDDAATALARQYDQQGRFVEEVSVLRLASARAPQPGWFYLKLGYAELNLHQAEAALHAFGDAESEDPFSGGDDAGTGYRAQLAQGRARAESLLRSPR